MDDLLKIPDDILLKIQIGELQNKIKRLEFETAVLNSEKLELKHEVKKLNKEIRILSETIKKANKLSEDSFSIVYKDTLRQVRLLIEQNKKLEKESYDWLKKYLAISQKNGFILLIYTGLSLIIRGVFMSDNYNYVYNISQI